MNNNNYPLVSSSNSSRGRGRGGPSYYNTGYHEDTRRDPRSPNYVRGTKLFVGQVPGVCTEEQLGPLFEKFGRLLEVRIMRERYTHRSKGCAWVRYESRDSALLAIQELHEKCVVPPQTNPLRVQLAGESTATTSADEAPPSTVPGLYTEAPHTNLGHSSGATLAVLAPIEVPYLSALQFNAPPAATGPHTGTGIPSTATFFTPTPFYLQSSYPYQQGNSSRGEDRGTTSYSPAVVNRGGSGVGHSFGHPQPQHNNSTRGNAATGGVEVPYGLTPYYYTQQPGAPPSFVFQHVFYEGAPTTAIESSHNNHAQTRPPQPHAHQQQQHQPFQNNSNMSQSNSNNHNYNRGHYHVDVNSSDFNQTFKR